MTPDQSAAAAYFLLLGGITLAVLCVLTALLERGLNVYFDHEEPS